MVQRNRNDRGNKIEEKWNGTMVHVRMEWNENWLLDYKKYGNGMDVSTNFILGFYQNVV